MARKTRKKTDTAPETLTKEVEPIKATHIIRYVDPESGEDIETGFASEAHANVLHHRLKAQNVSHHYEVSED